MAYVYRTPPYKHQARALDAARGRPGFAYLMEMRTGKSKVIIDEFCELYEAGDIDLVVIFAPKGVYRNWLVREIAAHMPERILGPVKSQSMDHFEGSARVALWKAGGGSEVHKNRLRALAQPSAGLRVLIMNTEALSTIGKALKYLLVLMRSARVGCYAAVDESTRIKNPGASRTKNMVKLVKPLAHVRRIASGLVSPRSPLDVYSQFAFLEDAPFGYRNYHTFQMRYAVTAKKPFGPSGRNIDVVVGYRNVEELHRKMAPLSFRVRKDECFDVPPVVYMPRDVELTDEQQAIYVSMRDNALAALGQYEFASATAVITQMLRLHQIICGHITDDDGTIHDIKSNRIDAMMEALEETDDKVVVWSWYQHDTAKIVAAIAKEYGAGSVVQYHGGTPEKERVVADARFREDPRCRFIVSSQATGGMGLDWRTAGVSLYYSSNPDLEMRSQSEERVFDPHARAPKACIDLVARGTVDEKFHRGIRGKLNLASTIMGDSYREWLI